MDQSCPEPGRLLALLDGTVPGDEQTELTKHLEHCTGCQNDLEELAGGTGWLRAKDLHLEADGADHASALKGVVHVLKTAGPEEHGSGTPPAAADVPLDFLEPSESPGHLGRLGPYEVIEVVGSGGMGVVLKAFEASLNRPVAIKVLNPSLASNATARRRFIREAQAAAAVSHDHVVTIHAVDEANGLPYLVMQYVSGMSLEEKLSREGPLEVKEVLRIGMQTASGLAAAHAQGLIHRDIKPANILLENGVERVKITDFGLARAVDDASVTESGVVTGTPQYMAPEQARGEGVDHRADLFSLGSVVYAMCTGRPPFRGSQTLAVLRRVADERPPSVQGVNPDVPDWLGETVARLHERDPERRFQSAEEVARVLGAHLARLQQPAVSGTNFDAAGGMGSLSALGPRHPGKGGQAAHATPNEKRGRSLASSLSATVQRHWLIAAVLLAVLAGGLGVTEATDVTGVTEFVATVLRIRTPQGTLVVKVDDPDVEVAVEGDGETITLRGAGAHEIRLRPGRHKVEALRDGRPLATQWATITRGGKEVVTVGLEEAARDGAAALGERPEITGRVHLGDPSRTAAHQKLWLYDAATMEIHRHLETDAAGNFTTGPLPHGGYFLLARLIDGRTGEATPYFLQSRLFYLYGKEQPRVHLDLLAKSRLLIRVAGPIVDRVEVEKRTVQLGIRFDVAPVESRLPLKPDPLADELAPRMGLRKDHSYGPFLKAELPLTIAVPPGHYQVRATVGRLTDPHFQVRGRSVISYRLGGRGLNSLVIGEGEEVELRYTLPEGYDAWVRSLVASLEGKKPDAEIEKPSAPTLERVATRKLPDVPTARGEQPTAVYAGRTLDDWLAEIKIEREPERLSKAIHAIGALRDTGRDREIAETIVELLRRYDLTSIDGTPEGQLKTAAIESFGNLDSDAALDVLVEALKSKNESDRRLGLRVLSRHQRAPMGARAKEVVPAILEASRDDDPDVRAWAIRIVTEIPGTPAEVVPRLREALGDADLEVIHAAARGLVEIAPDTEGLAKALLTLTKSENSWYHPRAAEELGRLGPRAAKAAPDLIEMLRELMVIPLSARRQKQQGGGLLQPTETDANRKLRRVVTIALGEIGPAAKKAIPLIEEELEDEDPEIRQAAAEALKKIKQE